MEMGFNNLSDMCCILKLQVHVFFFLNLLLLPSQYVEEDFVVCHRKAV